MSAALREQVLAAIRQALTNPTDAPLPPPRPVAAAAQQEMLVGQFIREAEQVGTHVASVADDAAARAQIRGWLETHGARRVVCASTPSVVRLGLGELSLPEATVDFLDGRMSAAETQERLLSADVGISDADYGLADTGTLAVRATPAQGRRVSLLPPVHIAVLSRQRILPNLAACFRALNVREETHRTSLLTLITGPSRTADIELTLTVGVHGPRALHILLVED